MIYKNISLITFVLAALLLSFEDAKGQDNIDWAVEQLRQLAPSEYYILDTYDRLPPKLSVSTGLGIMSSNKDVPTYEFMKEGDKLSCLSDLETNVHEIDHLLTHFYPYDYCRKNNRNFSGTNMYYFYVNESYDTVLFSYINFFPARLLINDIPENRRTFRFDDYINGNNSTQDNGLLGLLDEYNAYQHSMAVTWTLKEAYLTASDIRVEGYVKWMESLNSVVQAYYEFRFFILEYLRYARLNDPDLFDEIKEEPGLIDVYNHITQSYLFYIRKFENELTQGCRNYWHAQGYETYTQDGGNLFLIVKNNSYLGFHTRLEDREKLLPMLQSHRYDDVISELNILH